MSSPSNQVYVVGCDADLRSIIDAGRWTRPTQALPTPSRAHLRISEKDEYAAFTIVNMEERGVMVVRGVTLEELKDFGDMDVDLRIFEPIGLIPLAYDTDVVFAHLLDHAPTGKEPLLFFNQKMKELSATLSKHMWLQASRTPDNIIPLTTGAHKQFDSSQAAIIPSLRARRAYACALEVAIADKLVVQGDVQGVWEPSPTEVWDLDPAAVLAGASVREPVAYQSVQGGEIRHVDSYEYDWWRFPLSKQPRATDTGYYYPDEGLTEVTLSRPGSSWSNAVPLQFDDRPRPSFQASPTPMKAMSRFAWQKDTRAAEGDSLSFSGQGSAASRVIEHILTLGCVQDWRTFSAALGQRPEGEGELPALDPNGSDARLVYVRDHGDRTSGQRIFPKVQWLDEPLPDPTKKRRHDESDGGPESDTADGSSRRPHTRTRTTAPSTGASPSESSSTSSSSSSGRARATARDHGLRHSPVGASLEPSARATSLAIAAKEQELWTEHGRLMMFLDELVDEGSLALRDLLGGWEQIGAKLPGTLYARAEELLQSKRRLQEEIRQLKEEQRWQRVEEYCRAGSGRSLSPVDARRRGTVGSRGCSPSPRPSPGLSAGDNRWGSDAPSPQSPTEAF